MVIFFLFVILLVAVVLGTAWLFVYKTELGQGLSNLDIDTCNICRCYDICCICNTKITHNYDKVKLKDGNFCHEWCENITEEFHDRHE